MKMEDLVGTLLNVFRIGLHNSTTLDASGNTADRTLTLPDKDGTVATIADVAAKQDALVSGTNIKTINGESILGAGDMTLAGGGGGVPTFLGVGDTVLAWYTVDAPIAIGDLIAGANLVVNTAATYSWHSATYNFPFPSFPPTGTALSGTWRAQAGAVSATTAAGAVANFFTRVS